MRRGLAVLLALGLALGLATYVAADESPDDEIARRHFEAGQAAYAQHDYERALREFEQARTARPVPALDYDIARCLDRMERRREAIDAYEQFAARGEGAELDEARARIVTLRKRMSDDERSTRRSPPASAIIGVGVVGLATLGAGAGLLGWVGARYHTLDGTCDGLCARSTWSDLPPARDAGVALLAIGGVAAMADLTMLGLHYRRRP